MKPRDLLHNSDVTVSELWDLRRKLIKAFPEKFRLDYGPARKMRDRAATSNGVAVDPTKMRGE